MPREESLQFIQESLTFWNKLSEAEKGLILQNSNCLNYRRGENVHSSENDCMGVLLIKSGELRAYMLSEDGREITLYRIVPGDVCILSASCILKNITFDVHIDSETDSEAILINSSIFSKLQEENVYVENFALKAAVSRFSDVMWSMEQILFMKFDRRLAAFLFDESAKSGSADIKLTHNQIAKHLGSAREVVSRMLKQFENEKIITLYRGGTHILDREKLRQKI